MNNLEATVKRHLELCLKKEQSLAGKAAELPEGNIRCYHSGKYEYFAVLLPDKTRRYIRKADRDYARQLALKKFYLAQLHDIRAEIEACRRYLRYAEGSRKEEALFREKASPGLIGLIADSFITEDEAALQWEKAPYRRLDKFPEQRSVPTIKGIRVRSKVEAMVAAELTGLGIPFRYEQRVRIGGQELYPDFIALDMRTGKKILIEVFGMMDDPGYRDKYYSKMKLYAENGYIPDIDVLCFYDTPENPLDSRYVHLKLEFVFLLS